MADAPGTAGPPGARPYGLPLAVGGLLLGGAVALYAWTNTWGGIYALVALVIGGWLASVPDYVLMFWPALTPEPWHLTPWMRCSRRPPCSSRRGWRPSGTAAA